MNSPRHIYLTRKRVTPTYLRPFTEGLAELSERLHHDVQKFADGQEQLLYKIYDQGFEDGYAAALLEHDK